MYSAENTIWVLLSAILMFVMQAGFAMLETGFTQVKNAGNIAMKNLLDFAIGSLVFSLVGFWIMFGTGNGAWLSSGSTETALHFLPAGVPLFAFLAYQTMPTSVLSPTVQPCTMAECPMVQSLPTVVLSWITTHS